ncbi:MAG: hypothetical protein GF416_02335 [Candidatus Altiarchaeales archaeon]|nr:hypothetical protein [Candidatus Altiarchaeales archaeon]MBD3415957.1 hypothetical protein [Candidatus Altiarchaeales archaeon]
MKPLNADFRTGSGIDSLVESMSFTEQGELDVSELRNRLETGGFKFEDLRVTPSPGASLLAVDSSFSMRELSYHAIWATHAVALYGEYDGGENDDILVGHGSIPYGNLLYSSYLEAGEFIPYSEVDSRGNAARVSFEFSSLKRAYGELESSGLKPDFILVDGSLYTNLRNIRAKDGVFPECEAALRSFGEVLGMERVVGMVEDSHATDLSRDLGYNFTNMLLFEIALEPGEYVVDEREGISICYVKMPSKPLPFSAAGSSKPLTVRWEFNYPGFRDDLGLLAGIWMSESDILHPQIYMLRTADYLTRKIRVQGLLERIVSEKGLGLKYREQREI